MQRAKRAFLGIAVVLLLLAIGVKGDTNSSELGQDGGPEPKKIVMWEVVMDGTKRFPVTKLQSTKGNAKQNTHNAQRTLMGALSNAVESYVAFQPDPEPRIDPVTKQPVKRLWVMIERNTLGDQLHVRFKNNAVAVVLEHRNDTNTSAPLSPCGEVLRDSCAYALSLTVSPTCQDITFAVDMFPNSLWCQSLIEIVPTGIDGATIPIVTDIVVDVPTELRFTTLSQTDPVGYDSSLTIRIRLVPEPDGITATPFNIKEDSIKLWVTTRCDWTLPGLSSRDQIPQISEATEGDKICVLVEVETQVTVNVDIAEVLGCTGMPPLNSSTNFVVVDPTKEPDGTCSKLAEDKSYFEMFSLTSPACVVNQGSCPGADMKRFDVATTDFICYNTTNNQPATSACRGPSVNEPDGTMCPPGLICGGVGTPQPVTSRPLNEVNVPSALQPNTTCWPNNATFGSTAEVVGCTPAVDDSHCATICAPLRNFVAFEVDLPYPRLKNDTLVRFEVRLRLQLQDPLFQNSRRRALLSSKEVNYDSNGAFDLLLTPDGTLPVLKTKPWPSPANGEDESFTDWVHMLPDFTKATNRIAAFAGCALVASAASYPIWSSFDKTYVILGGGTLVTLGVTLMETTVGMVKQ